MRRRVWAALIAATAAAPVAAAPAADLAKAATDYLAVNDAENRGAAVDYGYGAGVKPPRRAARLARTAPAATPAGGPQASVAGVFGPSIPWPIVAIHEVLLPDGRVMSYGTNQTGAQGAQLLYDVWNPALGSGLDAHLVLPNTTATDIFCGGQSIMWATGETLTTGGDLTVKGVRNFSISTTTIFSPQTNTIRAGSKMQYPRWYDSVVPTPNGELLVLGGRQGPGVPTTTPEIYNQSTGWRTLTGATSAAAFTDFVYPRGYASPDGRVFVVASNGREYYLTTAGSGTITQLPTTVPAGNSNLPTVMFAPGKFLSVRNSVAGVLDITGVKPSWVPTAPIDQLRSWSSGAVLPNGKVLVVGGSAGPNQLASAAYKTETWDPATGAWTVGATAAHPRLYHSNALLLPDATVLTNGGGAPGPVINLNGEIYYPPYLYLTDGSGLPAVRPTLASAPAAITRGQPMVLTVGDGNAISRVTFVRTGSTTHANNGDQRFIELPFTQAGNSLSVTMSADVNYMLAGNWMAFVWQNGVPSVAKIVLVPS